MKLISGPVRALKSIAYVLWATVEFIAAFIYYLLTEIFVDPFILIKPIKIAAQWLYGNCERFPIISLYFTYLVWPKGKHQVFRWLSQTPWAVAIPPAAIVALTAVIKLMALSIIASHPLLAAILFVSDKITLVPIALRMWDEVRLVVRQDPVLRQVDNVVHFLFHELPIRAKDIVVTRMRALKLFMAPIVGPIRTRLHVLTQPLRDFLSPFGHKLKVVLKAWTQQARQLLRTVLGGRKDTGGRTPGPAADPRSSPQPSAANVVKHHPTKNVKHQPGARIKRKRRPH